MRQTTQDDLYELVEKNAKMTEQALAELKKIRRHFLYESIKGWIKTGITVALLVAAFIALPRFLDRLKNQLAPVTGNPEFQRYLQQYPELQKYFGAPARK